MPKRARRDPQPKSPDEPEEFDLRQRHADAELAAQQETARQWDYVPPVVRERLAQPATPPLEEYLDALIVTRAPRGAALPPAGVAAKYDPELEERIVEVGRAAAHAMSLAFQWQEGEPGHPGFHALLNTADDDAILGHLAADQPRAWLRAWRAQQHLALLDAEVRAYAHGATELHERLEHEMVELSTAIGATFEKVQGRNDQRIYDRALDLIDEWCRPAELVAWCRNPAAAFRAYRSGVLPADCVYRQWDANGKLTGQHHYEVPLEALDAPRVPTANPLPLEGSISTTREGSTITSTHRRGLFGRG